ncbi:MAG: alanine--tRNA ligase [Bacteroidetes bacterium]|nr:alanine--tRNA ligase [Bacteroidota bacterium]
MTSSEIRTTFLEFFRQKGHAIIPSSPIVVKNDPTLMFTNAGMNRFKEIFLGNNPDKYFRVADTQKCLRVSGKHNDLEDVGTDGYHHTMFEMLGNWSFGDQDSQDGIGNGYFKKEAIEWAWELLTGVYKIPADRLYATVFEGNGKEKTEPDSEAFRHWEKIIGKDRIIYGSKKDNFWEMGDTGPCGPCSEIHIDLRPDEERKNVPGKSLVNQSHPKVIELWNLVFIQYNRMSDGSLKKLPARHIDTGMGFERLCMVLQEKYSNYDTDIFSGLITETASLSEFQYGSSQKTDIAFRVIVDHLRAISFAIGDGQLPSNTGAGYVIRRILRRAVRYGYSSLQLREPFLHKLVPVLVSSAGNVFPELTAQKNIIEKIIFEEEESFLHTLDKGLKRIDLVIASAKKENKKTVDGKTCFELYDTYGFPADLTALILREQDLAMDEKDFQACLGEQKLRSRKATTLETGDWTKFMNAGSKFVGYDMLNTESDLVQYRKVKTKGRELFQLVFTITPFYPEGGGQVGDTGIAEMGNEKLDVLDTKKENELIVHYVSRIPGSLSGKALLMVDGHKRKYTACNHTATHLLHAALRNVLGTHVQQRGSLVNHEQLSFDFSHYEKVTDKQLTDIETVVNRRVRDNISGMFESMPLGEAKKLGAMALFGEKYGETVRVVSYDKNFSVELCGGTHVTSTGEIGFFKITEENAVAAGIRRIYALTAAGAEEHTRKQLSLLEEAYSYLKTTNLTEGIKRLLDENQKLRKEIELFENEKTELIKQEISRKISDAGNFRIIISMADVRTSEQLKNLAFELKNTPDKLLVVLGGAPGGRPQVIVALSGPLNDLNIIDAGQMVRILAEDIDGGGGGQKHFAAAGGKNAAGLEKALAKAGEMVREKILLLKS